MADEKTIYDDAPQPDQIITVKDFVDNMTYYLMRPVTDFSKKVTIVTHDRDTGKEFRYIVNKDAVEQFARYAYAVSGIKVGNTTAKDVYRGDRYTGRRSGDFDYNNKDRFDDAPSNKIVIKIIDPADNSVYEGVDKHKIEANLPVPGQLISVPDIKNLLISCGQKMYTWKNVYVSAWRNLAYENVHDGWPQWNQPGGNGWVQVNNSPQWSFQQLQEPKESLYTDLLTSDQLKEDDIISIYQMKYIASKMYNVNNQIEGTNMYFLSCHNNCHHQCHCARW